MPFYTVLGFGLSLLVNVFLLCSYYASSKKNEEYKVNLTCLSEKILKQHDNQLRMRREIDTLNQTITAYAELADKRAEELKEFKEDSDYWLVELRKQLNTARSQIRQQRSDFRQRFKR